ncbi:MAG: HAMP domain-containing sensor histidine kinase [Acidimicrobiales bacterium]
MSRRITVAIVGVVIGTMLLAGLGTLVATRVAGRAKELGTLEQRADAIADLVPNLDRQRPAGAGTGTPTTAPTDTQAKLVKVLGLSGVAQLRITRTGQLVGAVPLWVANTGFDVDALRRGTTISGVRGNRLWAAAARANANGSSTVALVTDTREAIIGPALRWLLVSAAVAVLLGVGVSIVLGRRLSGPVRRAVDATQRIAGGDLAARLPQPSGAHDELASLALAINSMAGELERSRLLEHQFLMSVSHDLRTPLTSIRGYAEAIADGVGGDPQASAAVIVTESQRLERLVADLLDLAKLDARQFGFRMADTRLGEVIGAAVRRIGPEAAAAGLDVRVANDLDPVVHVDADRLTQVVGNLSSNSLKFARSAVWVRTRPETGADGRQGVAIDVADDGPGIDPADLPHVFERLYQAQSRVAPRESGSGLGLAIVKELVDGMGGAVAVASVPGTGTTFTVWVPTR